MAIIPWLHDPSALTTSLSDRGPMVFAMPCSCAGMQHHRCPLRRVFSLESVLKWGQSYALLPIFFYNSIRSFDVGKQHSTRR